jgi:hypothetical protein
VSMSLDATSVGGKFDAMWDRASQVAIPTTLRKDYVKVMTPGGKILLVALDKRKGLETVANSSCSPFSIPEATVGEFYESQNWVDWVQLWQEENLFANDPEQKARYKGLESMYEPTFFIQAKQKFDSGSNGSGIVRESKLGRMGTAVARGRLVPQGSRAKGPLQRSGKHVRTQLFDSSETSNLTSENRIGATKVNQYK